MTDASVLPHAVVAAPESYDELFRRDGPYIEKMVRKELGPAASSEDVEDVAQYIGMKLVYRDVLDMYDPDHPSKASWHTFLGRQVILYCQGQRETIARHAVREPAQLDAPAGEDQVSWYELYAGKYGQESWDEYPSLTDSEVVAKLRSYLASVPVKWSGPVSLVDLFDLLVRRVYAGEELTAPVLVDELHLSPSAARHGLHILRSTLRAARPRPVTGEVGGVKAVTREEAEVAIELLEAKSSTAVRQTLAAAGSRLAAMDYHAVAKAEIKAYPELKLPPGTKTKHHGRVKLAVMHRLRGLLDELAGPDDEELTGRCLQCGQPDHPGACEPEPVHDEQPTALELLESELWHLGATPAALEKIMELVPAAARELGAS